MMISPSSYIEEKQNWNLDKLYKEKEHLEQYISDYKQGKIKEKEYFVNPSPEVIASVYEDYLIELNILIAKKERVNITEKKYIELTDYEKIDIFLQKNDFFDGAEIYKIFNKDGNAEVFIKDGEQEIEFYLYEVDDFTMVYFTDETYIDSITVNKIDEKISLEIDDNGIYISAKRIKLRAFCPAIVENIETFSYRNVPFPINRTKRIIRRSSKEEYEEYNSKNINLFKEEYDYLDDDFEFEDYKNIKDRAKKLPFIKSQKVEWQSSKENEDGSFTMPFPKYDKTIFDWIEAFHNLKLLDHNHVENFDYIKDKNIEDLNFDEILSYLTHIIRGERFCDGMIASNLENGTIELLEKRLFSYLIEFIEIDDNNLKDFDEKDVMFFSLAEGRAMGEPNGIEIVTKKENDIKLYHTNILSFDVKKLYSKFSTLKTLNCGIFGAVTGVQNGFMHVDMGVGNHLFINYSINKIFQEKIKVLQPAEIYSRWLNIGLDILNYDWSNNNE